LSGNYLTKKGESDMVSKAVGELVSNKLGGGGFMPLGFQNPFIDGLRWLAVVLHRLNAAYQWRPKKEDLNAWDSYFNHYGEISEIIAHKAVDRWIKDNLKPPKSPKDFEIILKLIITLDNTQRNRVYVDIPAAQSGNDAIRICALGADVCRLIRNQYPTWGWKEIDEVFQYKVGCIKRENPGIEIEDVFKRMKAEYIKVIN
jgi:hypothetical protein